MNHPNDAREDNGQPKSIYPERRTFDRLLVPLTARCMNAPLDGLDAEIEKGLKDVVDFFGGDRALLWEFSEDGREAALTHYHAEDGAEPTTKTHLHESLPYMFDSVLGLKNLCVSDPDDLPPSAVIDREYLERAGIRSFLVIPLLVGGAPRGALSLACIRSERSWTNADLFHFQRIGIVLASALDRRRSHRLLEQRMRFETMIADLSAVILKSTGDDIDREIEGGLARVAEFFRVDRCALLGRDPDSRSGRVTHAWYGEGIPQVPENINLADLFPWAYEKLIREKTHISTARLADLPPEAEKDRQSWTQMGVRSSLDIPVVVGEHVDHAIVVQSFREEREWPDEYIPRLRLMGELFVSAISRRHTEESLRESEERFRKMADTAPVLIWMSGIDKRCTYFNQGWLEFTGRTMEQELGNGWTEGVHPDDRERCLRDYMTSFDKREPFAMEYRLRAANGAYRLIYDMGKPRFSPSGEFLGYLGSCIDITERKQVEEELRQAYIEISRLKEKLEAENVYLRSEISMSREIETIIGRSDAIKYVQYRINQVASLHTTVLIVGETGTGKGLVARAVHERSLRKDRPLIHVNCAVLPASLIESELFGREKGAFTGAQAKQIGRFELADQGTIFLDEIAELPIELQAKLLRVVESGEFERLGDPRTVKVDVRIIASTNRNLEEEIRKGRFREDLFYRLNVFPITVPPLSQRTEDIPLIVDALIARMNKQLGRGITSVPQEVMRALQGYSWPGNVRELENVIERAVIMTKGPVLRLSEQLGAVQPPSAGPREPIPSGLADVERSHIQKTLEKLKWKIEGPGGAALALGLKPSTLRTRMQKLNIRRPTHS